MIHNFHEHFLVIPATQNLFKEQVLNLTFFLISRKEFVFQGSEPTALSLLIAAVNGQQFAWDAVEGCDTCGEAKAGSKCSKCKMVGSVRCACLWFVQPMLMMMYVFVAANLSYLLLMMQ